MNISQETDISMTILQHDHITEMVSTGCTIPLIYFTKQVCFESTGTWHVCFLRSLLAYLTVETQGVYLITLTPASH